MDPQNNGYVRAETLTAGREEDVEISIGKVRIRRLGLAELIEARASLIDVTAMATAREDDPAPRTVNPENVRSMARVVQKAVVAPALGLDPAQGPTVDDLPFLDVALLFTRIMALSGASRKAGQDLVPS